MKAWNDYKEHVKAADSAAAQDIKEAEEIASIASAMFEPRNTLGLSQRELAAKEPIV